MLSFSKSKWSKVVSLLLVAVMLFTMVDLPLSQKVWAEGSTTAMTPDIEPVPVEIPSENTEYATIYDNGDGTKTA